MRSSAKLGLRSPESSLTGIVSRVESHVLRIRAETFRNDVFVSDASIKYQAKVCNAYVSHFACKKERINGNSCYYSRMNRFVKRAW